MTKPTSIPQLPICWINELDGDLSVSTSTVSQISRGSVGRDSYIVVNAARPLPGEETWTDRFRCGIYYGAGNLVQFGKTWAELDAKELRLVSNARILRLVIEEAYRRGYSDKLNVLRGFTPEQLAEQAVSWLNMPFFAKEAAVSWPQMLDEANWSAPED